MKFSEYVEQAFDTAFADNIVCYDSEASPGQFSPRLVGLMCENYREKFGGLPHFILVPHSVSSCSLQIPAVQYDELKENQTLHSKYLKEGTLPWTKLYICILIGSKGQLLGAY